jgi:hypothetical protein
VKKEVTINRRKPALSGKPVEELTPTPDPPAERRAHRIIMNVFGKRFELTSLVEVRAIKKGPAKVIEMPRRPAI